MKKYIEDNPKFYEELDKKVRDNFSKAFENALVEEEVDEEQEIDPDEDTEE